MRSLLSLSVENNANTNGQHSAVVSAYKTRAQRLGSAAAPDAKLSLDLKFAYNIVFEMCEVEGHIMGKRDKSLNRMCFSGLGCLYRAAVDLVEVYPKGASTEDVKQLRKNLEWFSGHWKVAGKSNNVPCLRTEELWVGELLIDIRDRRFATAAESERRAQVQAGLSWFLVDNTSVYRCNVTSLDDENQVSA